MPIMALRFGRWNGFFLDEHRGKEKRSTRRHRSRSRKFPRVAGIYRLAIEEACSSR